jgi:hypothetical protein
MGLDLHAGTPGTPENDYEDAWYAPDLHARWSYTGFGQFRAKLAIVEGFFLDDMEGFTEDGRSWDLITTPLKPLLNHSDCDGEMTPAEAAEVWPRLEEIAEQWSAEGELDWNLSGMRALIDLLRYAAENETLVLFR